MATYDFRLALLQVFLASINGTAFASRVWQSDTAPHDVVVALKCVAILYRSGFDATPFASAETAYQSVNPVFLPSSKPRSTRLSQSYNVVMYTRL